MTASVATFVDELDVSLLGGVAQEHPLDFVEPHWLLLCKLDEIFIIVLL